MNSHHTNPADKASDTGADIDALINDIRPTISANATMLDRDQSLLRENVACLKAAGLMTVGIPTCYGGGGVNHETLCRLVQRISRDCSSTGLVMAMHCHQVAILSKLASGSGRIESLLRNIASNALMLLSTGGSDWLDSSGEASRVDGGYVINARKSFTSGAEIGDVIMSSAVDRSTHPAMVVHFAVPAAHSALRVERTWHTLGMRGTGSQDIIIPDMFVPETDILGRRQSGAWSRINHLTAMLAFPLIYAAYLGIAEAIRAVMVSAVAGHPESEYKVTALGEIETCLHAARVAHEDMVRAANGGVEGFATTNRVMMGRRLVEREVLAIADKAMSLLGGRAYYDRTGFERLFRDIQAARFHPLTKHPQQLLAGILALDRIP